MNPQAHKIMAMAGSRGVLVKLGQGGDTICLHGPREALAELRPAVVAYKPDLLRLLREPRKAAVSRAWAEAFARLSSFYPDLLVGNLWAEIKADFPDFSSGIDKAERAADIATLNYQAGCVTSPDAFLTDLARWEGAWMHAMAAIARKQNACDCGCADATVMVTADTGPLLPAMSSRG